MILDACRDMTAVVVLVGDDWGPATFLLLLAGYGELLRGSTHHTHLGPGRLYSPLYLPPWSQLRAM